MVTTRWLDEREARAWRGFQRMRAQLHGRLNQRLQASANLSIADYEVLVHLSEAPQGRLRPFELAEAMQWEKSRLSHHLRRMEGRGLVCRRDCPSDARGWFVVISEAGRAAIEAAAPQHVEAVRHYLVDVLSPSQLDALGDIAEAVVARLAEDEAEADGDPGCG